MKRSNQKGAALIFAMIFVLVLSIMAASLMFISQSETWASLNYRLMTQSRYGAEAGLHAAANYLMYNYTPSGGAADPITAYNMTGSPVTYGGNPVALGVTMNGLSANYPLASVVTNFGTNTAGTLPAGNANVNYTVSAELMTMKQFQFCGSSTGQPLTGQVWKLTSHGDISGARNSEVEVSALLELHVTPCFNYAGFATGTGCGSIQFNGGGTIDSYDSGALTMSNGSPVTQLYDGNLGSNGNLNAAPNTTVNGTFSSPDTGVGACAAGAVDALSGNTTAVTGCVTGTTGCGTPIVKLRATESYTLPATDYPICTAPAAGCDGTTATALNQVPVGNTLTPGNFGDISTPKQLTLNPGANCSPGVYYFNSIQLKGNGQLTIGPCVDVNGNPTTNPPTYQPIIINIVGANGVTPLDLGGNGLINSTFNASLIQINYCGTGAINIHGNGNSAGVIYAPNAPITLSGNGTIYGSVIGSQLIANGNPVNIHYDRSLSNILKQPGNWTLDTFTWSKY
jgi:Tfp pilus assembly protein PilX